MIERIRNTIGIVGIAFGPDRGGFHLRSVERAGRHS